MKYSMQYSLRYILWREKITRTEWIVQLAQRAGCDHRRAEALLQGATIQQDEWERLVQSMNLSQESFELTDLISADRVDVLTENLRCLINSLGHGQKKLLAVLCGVHPITVSRWLQGKQHPTKEHLDELCHHFGLVSGTDLTTEPLFLALRPLSVKEQRAWVSERVTKMDTDSFRRLFPVFERLLEKD